MAISEAVPAAAVGDLRGRGLHIALWVGQVLLAFVFCLAGVMHATMPDDQFAQTLAWTGTVPMGLVRYIGVVELAAAVGLLVPAVTRIKPVLTAWAAAGLALLMLYASLLHVSRGEVRALGTTVILGALAAFVARGRFEKAPIAPRA